MVRMSAIGTYRTSLFASHMSAFGGKADIPICTANVRFFALLLSPHGPRPLPFGAQRVGDFRNRYSEWLGCLDTRDYTRTLRKDHAEAMAASKLCPTVNWQLDGSITSVVACQQR
jgi:hypothetical protein